MSTTTTTQSTTGQEKSKSDYIDLHTQGIGIARRYRIVKPKKGAPFTSVSISAMFGEKGVQDGISFVPYDVKAVTQQALEVLTEFQGVINDPNKTVLVRFQIGDAYPDTYQLTQGKNAGDTRFVLKGRLLKITHLWAKSKDAADEGGYELLYKLSPPADAPSTESTEKSTGTEG